MPNRSSSSYITNLVHIIRVRRLKRLCSIRSVGCKFVTLEQDVVSACHTEGLTDVVLVSRQEEADGLFVDKKEGGKIYPNGQTVFEVSRFQSPKFEDRDLISVVYDIETINMDVKRKVEIDDVVVSMVLNMCIVTKLVDTTYLCTADPIVKSWERVKGPVQIDKTNRFGQLYSRMVTSQYIEKDTGQVVNVIYCPGGEKQLLMVFNAMINMIRPHNLVTFNGESFDLPFQIRSCFRHGIDMAAELSIVLPAFCSHAGTNHIRASKKKFQEKAHRSGFISKNVLELKHDSFTAFIHTDLCKYNKGSLNEICQTKLGMKKVDLKHAEIPVMYTTRHEKLFIYNVRDTDLTTRLFFKDYFLSLRYYFTLEKLTSIFWDVSSSMHRSAPAYQANYSTNERFGFVQPVHLKPGRLHNREVFKELVAYFLVHNQRQDLNRDIRHEDVKQLLYEYHNGALDLKTEVKKLPDRIEGVSACSVEFVVKMLRAQLAANKKQLLQEYTTVDLLVLLAHVSNGTFEDRVVKKGSKVKGGFEKEVFEEIFTDFVRMFDFTVKAQNEDQKREKRMALYKKEHDKFLNFMYYLTITYRFLSPHERADLLWEAYSKHYKTSMANMQAVKMFYDQVLTCPDTGCITRRLYDAVIKSQAKYEPRRFTFPPPSSSPSIVERVMSCLEQEYRTTLAIKNLQYDGAFIADPIKGINDKYPVVVVDIASQYPSCTLAMNMSPQTEITLDQIRRHGLVEGRDFYMVNHRRCDDTVSFQQYLDLDMVEYVENNYTFFLTELEDQSRLAAPIVAYTKQIKARLKIKAKIKKASSDEEKRVLGEMSDAFKININSYYGVLGLVSGIPKFMACVTAMGRRTIHNIRNTLKRLYDKDLVIRYGDSVTGDTPIIIRYNGVIGWKKKKVIDLLTIDKIAERFGDGGGWHSSSLDGKEWCLLGEEEVEVWSDRSWTEIRQVVRHRLAPEKSIFRVLTHTGCVDVTDDHSLLDWNGLEVSPRSLEIDKTPLLHHQLYVQPGRRTGFDCTRDDCAVKEARILGFFFGDGSCGVYTPPSSGGRCKATWALNNKDLARLELYRTMCEEVYPQFEWKIYDTLRSSGAYKLTFVTKEGCKYGEKMAFIRQYRKMCYLDEAKVIPLHVLNAGTWDIRQSFFNGLYDADGRRETFCQIDQKNKISAAYICLLANSLEYKTSINTRSDKPHCYSITCLQKEYKRNPWVVKKCSDVTHLYKGSYVYDLTTANHHFAAGIGSLVVHNTDSVFFSMSKTVDEILGMDVDEATDYFNGTKVQPVVTREQVGALYGDIRGGRHADETDYFKSCYIVQKIFDLIVPILDAANPTQVNLEIEKVMIPTIQCTRKKYAAYIPLACRTLTKGLSNANRVALKATKNLLDRFLSNIKNRHPEIMLDLYHHLGQDILVPLVAGTIDLDLISKNVSHNRSKNMTNKAANMIERMEEEGMSFFFDTVKDTTVNVEPIGKDVGWSVVTVDQFRRGKYKLHVEKTLKDVMTEFMTLISEDYTVDTCIMFEALAYGHYEMDLTRMPVGHGPYEMSGSPTMMTVAKQKQHQKMGTIKALRHEAMARHERRSKPLPSNMTYTRL